MGGQIHMVLHLPVWSLRFPGVITAEVPETALRIPTAIEPPAVVLVCWRHDDPRAGSRRARMMRIDIGDDDVRTLRNRQVGVAEWCLERSKRIIARRTEHDHAVSENQLRMSHSAVVGGHHQVPVETERRA